MRVLSKDSTAWQLDPIGFRTSKVCIRIRNIIVARSPFLDPRSISWKNDVKNVFTLFKNNVFQIINVVKLFFTF